MSDKKEKKETAKEVSIKFSQKDLDCRFDSTRLFGIDVELELDKDKNLTGFFLGKTSPEIKSALVKAGKAK